MDDILDYPEDMILPVRFSHSVHNAAAAYLSSILKITGPAYAVTGFDSPLFEALQLVHTLLHAKMCPQVLLIGIEERGMLTATPLNWHRNALLMNRRDRLRNAANPPGKPEDDTALDRNAGTAQHPDTCTLGLTPETIRQLADPCDQSPITIAPAKPI